MFWKAHLDTEHRPWRSIARLSFVLSCLCVFGVLVWQGITSSGNPDPTVAHLSPHAAMIDTGVLVFREGLECILVLSAITASMQGANHSYRRPIAIGAAIGLGATTLTWFAVVGVLSTLANSLPALDVQAATGLLAIIVLLVIMNWFFHKVYWTGWISLHNRRKRALLDTTDQTADSQQRLLRGLILLGFASVYREGFEVVLFLQTLRLQVGSLIVLVGVLIGLVLTAIIGVLTFVAHQRLPYKKMLVFTGIMLGAVLLVMVGEQAQEMQLAHWIPTTKLDLPIPAWMGLWFSVIPTVETLLAQALAAVLVIGSYIAAQYTNVWAPRRRSAMAAIRP
ncbi:MAG: FTR1 family protein [Herpetosiphonaceae bacterium]|nr:FTR1 family protein [Herpetosiphonaceae bacterium]